MVLINTFPTGCLTSLMMPSKAESEARRGRIRRDLIMISEPLTDLSTTRLFAQRLARLVQPGDFIALRGGLGAGKTTFARFLISALMGEETEVPSPTYTIVQTYNAGDLEIFHFDLYRIETPDELEELGWDDTYNGLSLVEWPQHAGDRLPRNRLDIEFSTSTESRTATLVGHGEYWQSRINEL